MSAIDLILAGAILCVQPSVIDGDTFRCADRTRIRVWGIDTPDPSPASATRTMANLITGQTLACLPKGKSWDRIVAQCFAGSTDIGAEMVRSGEARDCPRYSRGLYKPLELETEAVLTARAGKVKC